MRLRRRGPLQKIAARDGQAVQSSEDGVRHRPGLIRPEDELQGNQRGRLPCFPGQGAEVSASGEIREQLIDQERQQRGQGDGREKEKAPRKRRGSQPAQGESPQNRRHHDRPAQIVEHFPASERRHRRVCAQHPGEQLPIAARPTMLPRGRHVVAGRIFLDHLDIRCESTAGVSALEQIVTEQTIVADAIRQGRLESGDVVDALAAVRALAEHVLIDIRDGECVRIDAARTRKDPLEERRRVTDGQGRRHPRLQYPVPRRHEPFRRIDDRFVQRVRHLADERQRRAARQARIRIQTDDVPHPGGRLRGPAADGHEARVRRSAQQEIEFVELAAFALPTHPTPLGLVPKALAMQEQETIVAVDAAMQPVQPRDSGGRCAKQLFVLGRGFRRRIDPIGEQRKADVAVLSGQVMYLESAHRFIDVRTACQKNRHRYHGAQFGGYSVHEFEAGQHTGAAEMSHPKIDDADSDIGRRQKGEQRDEGGGNDGGTRGSRGEHHRSRHCDAQEGNAAAVTQNPGGPRAAGQALIPRNAVSEFPFQLGPSCRHQVVAGFERVLPLAHACAGAAGEGRALRQVQGAARHVHFRPVRTARKVFDRVPIKVAGRKVESRERTALAHQFVDETDAFEEFCPIDR